MENIINLPSYTNFCFCVTISTALIIGAYLKLVSLITFLIEIVNGIRKTEGYEIFEGLKTWSIILLFIVMLILILIAVDVTIDILLLIMMYIKNGLLYLIYCCHGLYVSLFLTALYGIYVYFWVDFTENSSTKNATLLCILVTFLIYIYITVRVRSGRRETRNMIGLNYSSVENPEEVSNTSLTK